MSKRQPKKKRAGEPARCFKLLRTFLAAVHIRLTATTLTATLLGSATIITLPLLLAGILGSLMLLTLTLIGVFAARLTLVVTLIVRRHVQLLVVASSGNLRPHLAGDCR